jgi:hypothetical protein
LSAIEIGSVEHLEKCCAPQWDCLKASAMPKRVVPCQAGILSVFQRPPFNLQVGWKSSDRSPPHGRISSAFCFCRLMVEPISRLSFARRSPASSRHNAARPSWHEVTPNIRYVCQACRHFRQVPNNCAAFQQHPRMKAVHSPGFIDSVDGTPLALKANTGEGKKPAKEGRLEKPP